MSDQARERALAERFMIRFLEGTLSIEGMTELMGELQSSTAQACYLAAMSAVCEWCRKGYPIIEDKVSNSNGWYYHKPDPRGLAFRCVAYPILALAGFPAPAMGRPIAKADYKDELLAIDSLIPREPGDLRGVYARVLAAIPGADGPHSKVMAAPAMERHDAGERPKDKYLRKLVQPLKDVCDREWKDESPEQVVTIAANGIYWREKEIRERLEDKFNVMMGRQEAEIRGLIEKWRSTNPDDPNDDLAGYARVQCARELAAILPEIRRREALNEARLWHVARSQFESLAEFKEWAAGRIAELQGPKETK